MPEFQTQCANLLKARFPLLYLPTWEEERALASIRAIAQDPALIKTPRTVYVWKQTTGLSADGRPGREETRAPVKALEVVETLDEAALFVFLDFHAFFGGPGGRAADPAVIRKVRDVVPALKNARHPKNVIFVSPTLQIPTELQKDVTILDFDLPTFADIKQVLDAMISANRQSGRIAIELADEDAERLAKAATGLTLQEAENAFARAMVQDGKLDASDLEVVLEEKRQTIKKSGILEFVSADVSMDSVGGLENLKRWLKRRDKSWLDAARRYSLPSPKGVLITGVPGCGKSLLAKAVSASWQLPLLRLDIGKIFHGLIGSSEENMRTAIRTAEAIAPCILWIDEIEKGFSAVGGGNDGGTSTRIFGTFLTWMQEKQAPVFVVATANNIDGLPPELLRKGRFDEIFFVDLPTRAERVQIFKLHMNKRLTDPTLIDGFSLDEATFGQLADATEGYIGAEIEQIVISALFEAYFEDRAVKLDDLLRAARNTVPLSVTQAEEIRAIRDWANVRAVAATPREQREGYAEAPAAAPSIAAPPSTDAVPAGAAAGAGEDVASARGGRTVDF
ncbi:MAG TPA: AAA family ATPase [Longimicrobium sp.]|nr:AAA family ATPase [Longimicrobium sp.]